ncbi:hypothetical protein CSC2_02620 [Clostridium zeae]|uniref:Uncharacterized protein n=1 Tax=Clostridium zeae TaxID=2759022 RepID=A0ABQ1E4S1_9CLOT|nr:hypothetical protein [Clostridium zeae]GFZ29736.1 hypothetical protein CSC2_02620 [Clostridium zeae]
MQQANGKKKLGDKKAYVNKNKNSESNPVDTNEDKDMSKPVRGLPQR